MEFKYQYDDFKFINIIGNGAFGVIWKVEYIKTNYIYAIKVIDIYKFMKVTGDFRYSKISDIINNEINSLETLSAYPECNKNISCIYGHFEYNNKIYIIMEYIDGLSLDIKIKQIYNDFGIYEVNNFVLYFLVNISKILKFIHDRNIVHGDIKPDNILIENNNNIVLVDFGVSCIINSDLCKIKSGTLGYMSPELKNRLPKTSKVDIWAVGIILKNFVEIYNIHDIFINRLIEYTLVDNPLKRPDATKLLNYIHNSIGYKYDDWKTLYIPRYNNRNVNKLESTILLNNNSNMDITNSTVLINEPLKTDRDKNMDTMILNKKSSSTIVLN